MIKSTELRIGNVLEFQTAEGDTIDLKTDWETFNWVCQDEKGFNSTHSPIILTEEILIKLGYIPFIDNYYTISGHQIFKCNDMFLCDKNGVVLKYVHQLQNLYYVLTNKELNYENN